MNGIGPTIGGPRPGFGLRVRMDHNRALPTADFNCRCGEFAEDAVGREEVASMAVRAERHMRDDCALTDVRAAAGLRATRRVQQQQRKRK
ncbi:hypothetical protein [Streptomyces zaomyceticus]|uniref:hypothetical protein n=1 Tax=Streptomyces zaomyceticus TaxID=68286 RepID=UPI002E1316A5|nr:hypothetical protein OG237_15735 [Streptomyces zaomyceticus]